MAVGETLLTIVILLAIFILAYLKMTKKTLTEFIGEIREIVSQEKMEVIDL